MTRPAHAARPAALALVALLAGVLGSGCRAGARARVGAGGPAGPEAYAPATERRPAADPAGKMVVVEDRDVGRLSDADFGEFNRAWVLFVRHDPGWPRARDAWLSRGGAAPYVLSENLLRYFGSATSFGGRAEIDRIAESARAAGEPAVGYFVNILVLDTWPLKEPVYVPVAGGGKREVRVWQNDDVTRQHLAIILSAIGAPAVPRLSAVGLRAGSVSARRYAMYALGRIGTDPAVDAVAGMLGAPDWQDRGSAAKALGFALRENPRAKEPLTRAAADPDAFVRKKAQEALSGKTKSEF